MLLKRFYHEGLAQASYLLGCQATGEALVVDANRDAEQYVAAAAEHGLRITHVTETHIHADYVSGTRELARKVGALTLLSAEGGPDWQYGFATRDKARLLKDGDSFRVGNLRIDVVHTPGHTPEHLTFVVTDTPASDKPVGAFTGDFLFVGDVGRPDLLERAAHIEGTMRDAAGQLYHALRSFTSRFPEYIQIWPGHGAGSACGKALGAVPQTTLGYEKFANWALQAMDLTAFTEAVLAGQPDPPTYFATMKRLNRDGPPLLFEALAPRHAPASDLASVLREGDAVIDMRPADVSAAGFVPGTINIPYNRSFVTWAGWLLEYDRDFYLLTDGNDDAIVRTATKELAMIGLDEVAGWFGEDALELWRTGDRGLATTPQITPSELFDLLGRGGVQLLDVRSGAEYEEGHIAHARHIPLGSLAAQYATLDLTRPIVVHCESGGRSAIAATLLRSLGHGDVSDLNGGYTTWRVSGLPSAPTTPNAPGAAPARPVAASGAVE